MPGLIHIPTQCQQVLDIISEQGFINCNTADDAGITQLHSRMFEIKEIYGRDFFSITKVNHINRHGKLGYINDYRFTKPQLEMLL